MKISNYKDFLKFIKNLGYKPKLLLHACCAPCSTHCINLLKKYFDITIYYSNDNIYPDKEFYYRLDEINRFTKELNEGINVIDDGYNPNDYYDSIKGLETLGEKSERCYMCYKLRLKKTCLKAKELGFDFFSTTLSISPYKISKWINEIGYELEKEYDMPYLYSDFKKESGYLESIRLSNEYNLYRQDYCGCVYSLKERDMKENGN